MARDSSFRRVALSGCCHAAFVMCWLATAVLGGRASAAARVPSSSLGISHPVHNTGSYAMVGAIIRGDVPAGHHFCTASVVDSPGKDLIVTAAHCVSGNADGLYFAPGYHDGQAPYGVWALGNVTVAPEWTTDHNQDLDVAFIDVQPRDRHHIQDVVGGYLLGINESRSSVVRITGYPDSADAPITCVNRISSYNSRQMRIYCTAYTNGTSGSPWVINDHTVMGVIGGFQRGGNTPDISYSPSFDDAIGALYQQAVAAAP